MMRIHCLLVLTACAQLMPREVATSPSPAPEQTAARRPHPADEPKQASLPDVPATAAHPTVAWFVARTGEMPGLRLAGTGKATASVALAKSFALDHALYAIAPACLRDHNLTRTAAALARSEPIKDAAGVERARALIPQIKSLSDQELASVKDYSDHANGEIAAKGVAEALGAMGAEAASAYQPGATLDVRALHGWVELLEVCFDDTRPKLIERALAHYHQLLTTGAAPARSANVAVRPVHPGIATYVRVSGERASVAEMADLVAVDVGDTLRGSNVDVTLFVADVAVRDLAPRTLRQCHANAEADAIAKVAPIRNAQTLQKGSSTLMALDGGDGPNHLCIEAAANLAHDSLEAAFDAQTWLHNGINSEPSYARSAFNGWLNVVSGLADLNASAADVQKLRVELLTRAVAKLRTLPRRTETSREPR
jgi:hypothetical protein